MKIKYFLIAAILLIIADTAVADTTSTFSLSGYYGCINNNTTYIVECSQVIGGYCANNPMPANGYIQMLPDPGSNEIRGHLMIFQKDVPGKYLDNISFTYIKRNSYWQFITQSHYHAIRIKLVTPDTILLEPRGIY